MWLVDVENDVELVPFAVERERKRERERPSAEEEARCVHILANFWKVEVGTLEM